MFKEVDKSVLGDCPASVDMATGDISINKDVWHRYDDFEKRFIIEHEKGHYNQRTDSEIASDKYALEQMYGKYPHSLKRTLKTLCKVNLPNTKRYAELYKNALKLDIERNNNENAKEEFKKLEEMTKENLDFFIRKNRLDGVMETTIEPTTETVSDDASKATATTKETVQPKETKSLAMKEKVSRFQQQRRMTNYLLFGIFVCCVINLMRK